MVSHLVRHMSHLFQLGETCVSPFSIPGSNTVWDPHTRTQINQIEKVQRRAARYVTNQYRNTSSVTDMLQHFNWPSLEIRRTRVRLIMFCKIIHHVVAIHPLDTLLLPTTTITRYNLVVIHINIWAIFTKRDK